MKRSVLVGLVGLCSMALVACSNEKVVQLDSVPAPVRAVIDQQAAGATIKEVEMETINGVAVYEAEFVKEGKKYEVAVDATGKHLGTEIDGKVEGCCKSASMDDCCKTSGKPCDDASGKVSETSGTGEAKACSGSCSGEKKACEGEKTSAMTTTPTATGTVTEASAKGEAKACATTCSGEKKACEGAKTGA